MFITIGKRLMELKYFIRFLVSNARFRLPVYFEKLPILY
jgi:hypothetical protein